ncbi:MAG TPA: hypothetical protein G4O16_06705 [Dehalococcoidia bacterium]|nr:hypothetical protein [Dehalococcoidia bacterium]
MHSSPAIFGTIVVAISPEKAEFFHHLYVGCSKAAIGTRYRPVKPVSELLMTCCQRHHDTITI